MNKKKILILGGNYSTVEVVIYAKGLGYYVVVTSNTDPNGDAKRIADESLSINVTDHELLAEYIKENNISGIMTGASEFHLLNMIRLCQKVGLPCYATEEQWSTCENKQSFKNLCRQYGVPCVMEFSPSDDPSTFDYPVIVKPTDGCSARGITVCSTPEEYKNAVGHALEYSTEKKYIIEKFIENKGTTMSVRYIAVDGELYLEAVGDRYVLDANRGKALITAAAFYPSKYTEQYIRDVDEKVKAMFKGIGIKNGAFFMESIANPDGIWFYEMGLRVSGGQTYKITEQITGINELKMLINHACTGKMCEKGETKRIDPFLKGFLSASFTIPLREGTIATAEGVDAIKSIPEIGAIVQYWKPGDTILPKHIGTLDQLFCRIPVIVKGKERLAEIMHDIKQMLSVKDEQGNEMIIWSKLDEIYNDYMQ